MDDDWMDIDSSNSGNDDPGLNEIDMEILDSVGEAETDEDEDMDLDSSDLVSVEESDTDTDEEPYDDDTEITDPGHSPPVLNHGSKTEWHEGNLLLKNIGLQKLHDKGYVNLKTIRTDRTFGYSRDRSLSAARWRAKYEVQKGLCAQVNEPYTTKRRDKEGYGKLDEFHRIHPIFRQDNWTIDDLLLGSESNCLFNKLKPVLQLATLLLEDENIVGYIFSMLDVDNHKEITLHGIEEYLGEKVFWFEPRHNLSEKERQTVWRELYELSKTLRWTEEEALDLHGCTRGPRGSIEIALSKRHIDEVCREISCIEDAIDWTPGSDEESARLRVKFLLASTMVHEVMHALWRNKYYPNHEPFRMDTVVAELGFQWEQLLFSGIIDNPTEDRGSPYILCIDDWPFPYEGDETDPTKLMSPKKWGMSNVFREFAVEMSFVQSMFTHEFWAQVDRYGIALFRPRRMLGVRKAVVSDYWECESPVIRGPGDGEPPSPDGADSKGIIDRH